MADKKYKKIYFMFLFISLFFLVVVFAIWYSFRIGNKSQYWNKTKGTITLSEVIRTSKRVDGDGALSVFYDFNLLYEYKVSGNNYKCNTLSYKPQSRSKEESLIKKLKYPINKKITVYYNPLDPNQAVLERGSEIRLPIIFTVIFFICGLLSLLFWRKSYR
jgi:hypothetical protein